MLGLVFSFSQFLSIKITVFSKKNLYPIEDIDLLSSNLKKYIFYFRLFFLKFWGFENCQIGHILDQIMRALK